METGKKRGEGRGEEKKEEEGKGGREKEGRCPLLSNS